jgi:hypothetical protein
MKLSHFVRMTRANDGDLVFPDHPTQQPDTQHPEDLTGPNPHPTDFMKVDEVQEHGTWTLIEEEDHKALVVDRDQNYLIVTKTGQDWYAGPTKNLGRVGREKALQEFEQESDSNK